MVIFGGLIPIMYGNFLQFYPYWTKKESTYLEVTEIEVK